VDCIAVRSLGSRVRCCTRGSGGFLGLAMDFMPRGRRNTPTVASGGKGEKSGTTGGGLGGTGEENV